MTVGLTKAAVEGLKDPNKASKFNRYNLMEVNANPQNLTSQPTGPYRILVADTPGHPQMFSVPIDQSCADGLMRAGGHNVMADQCVCAHYFSVF